MDKTLWSAAQTESNSRDCSCRHAGQGCSAHLGYAVTATSMETNIVLPGSFALLFTPGCVLCRSIGAHVLIDDNPGYAIDCATAGINVLLYDWEGNYPWSKLQPW